MQDLQKEILSKYDIEIHSYENNTIEDIPQLLGKINSITDEVPDSIIQLLDSDYICGQSHINQAIAQAFKAFEEKQNFAKDKGLEICVRLSAQKQISEALQILGIKNSGNITVIYINTSPEQICKTEELLADRNDSLLNKYNAEDIVEIYGLGSANNIVDTINEKIALLALKK